MRNSRTATWLAQILTGLALIGGGAHVAWIFWPNSIVVTAASLAVAGLGLGLVVWVESTSRPQRLLREAQRSLQLPQEWRVEFEQPLPDGGGTAPIVVTRSDRTRFVVAVKDYKRVSLRKEITGREQALLGPNGRELGRAPLAELMRAAAALGAQPVLWLPKASEPRNLRHGAGALIVVMGSARHLKHALLGAEVSVARAAPPAPAAAAAASPSPRSKKKQGAAADAALSQPG